MLSWRNIRDLFPYIQEVPTIFMVVQEEIFRNHDKVTSFPFLVDPYAFVLAIRKQEGGRKGREFGIMHHDAIDTNLEVQAEWCMATIIKDTRRWHEDTLICVGGKSKTDFVDFIEYFGSKYCPVGARNDPALLNKYWLPNVRRNYEDFWIE